MKIREESPQGIKAAKNLTVDQIKVLPLGSRCNNMDFIDGPKTHLIDDGQYQEETGMEPKYEGNVDASFDEIVYIASGQHAVIKLSPDREDFEVAIYKNIGGNNHIDQCVEEIKHSWGTYKGVFSSGFGTCSFQVARVTLENEIVFIVSHLQAASALSAIADDLGISLEGSLDWVLNTTLCYEGAIRECYGTKELCEFPDKTLTLIRGNEVYPDDECLLSAFALTSSGILINPNGDIKPYWVGSEPGPGTSSLRYFATTFKGFLKDEKGTDENEIVKLYEEYVGLGYVVDPWTLSQLHSSNLLYPFREKLARLLAEGDINKADALVKETFPDNTEKEMSILTTTRYISNEEMIQWIYNSPNAWEHYAERLIMKYT